MEKKYLFFDIDGTLTNRATGGIVPSAKEALQRLEENIIRQKSLQRQMVLKIWSAMEEMDW